MTDIDLAEFEPPERPDFRRVGRWRLPHVMNVEGNKRVIYRRSSTAGKVLDDESNLTDWKLRSCVVGAAQRPELMALASTLDFDLNKKELRDIAEQCLTAGKAERRSITGTAVHAMFDHIDRADGWIAPPQFADLCNAYIDTLSAWGLIPIDIEVHCVSDQWKLAGMLDRRFRTTKVLIPPDGSIIPIGSVIVADTKTGRELEYASGSYVTQCAAYVDSLRYDVTTDERSPFDPPNVPDWALIIHADSAGTRVDVYWADLVRGRFGLALADEVRRWRRYSDLLILATEVPAPMEPPKLAPAPEPEPAAEAPTTAVEAPDGAGRHEYLARRVRAILAHSEIAGKALQREWPRGVPGLKQTGHTEKQLDEIEWIIGKVEFNHAVPLDENDPYEVAQRSHHPSARPIGLIQTARAIPVDKPNIQSKLNEHPRGMLIRRWIERADVVDYTLDSAPLANSLMRFANVSDEDWPDDDLTVMLDGSLRALGYENGVRDLGRFNPEHAPKLLTAAFAVAAGQASLLFDENNKPVVRASVQQIEWSESE